MTLSVDDGANDVIRKSGVLISQDVVALRTISGLINETTGIKYAEILLTNTNQTTIVAAVTGKRIRVLSLFFSLDNDADIDIKSNSTSLATIPLVAYQGMVLGANEFGWFQTDVGEAFTMQSDTTTNVGGRITYIEI